MSDRIAKEDYVDDAIAAIPPGGGAVDSVNGETGVVVLDAGDVGADVSGAAATAASGAASALSTHAGAADPHPAYALESALGTLATQSGTFSGTSSGTNTGDQTNISGNAATVTTNANLTGPVTSVGNATTIADAELAAIAGLTSAADKLPYFTGAGTASVADFTTAGRAIVDDADAAAQRTTLGLGTIATQAANSVSITGGAISGITDLAVADGGTGSSTALAARAALGAGSAAIRRYLPTGALYHNFDRTEAAANLALLATGRLSIVMIEMDAGVTLTSITFLSGTTALSVGVNQWFALFDSSRAKLRVTGDDTSTAWAANSTKTLNLATTFLTTYSGIYFVGIMVKATTVPSLTCASANANLAAVVLPFHGGNSTTGLTDPASCPDPAGTISGGVGFPYMWIS